MRHADSRTNDAFKRRLAISLLLSNPSSVDVGVSARAALAPDHSSTTACVAEVQHVVRPGFAFHLGFSSTQSRPDNGCWKQPLYFGDFRLSTIQSREYRRRAKER